MVVAHLARTRHLPLNACRVPGTDTCNLSQTSVRLANQSGDTPTRDNTLDALALRDTQAVDHFVLAECISDLNTLLEQALHKIYLLGSGATIDLDLLDVCLF